MSDETVKHDPIAEHRCSGQADCLCAVHVVWRAVVRQEGVELTRDQTLVVGTILMNPGDVVRRERPTPKGEPTH